MRCKRVTGSTCTTVVVALIVVVALVVALRFFVIWLQGIPGSYHEAYAAYASLVNIRSGLWSNDRLKGHLPPATAKDVDSGEVSSWRIGVYQSFVREGAITAPEWNGNISVNYDYHKAWNNPDNLRLEGLGARIFQYTQTDAEPARHKGKYGYYTTYYKAITGPGTAFDYVTPPNLKKLPKDLILIVRVEHSDTHWMEPGDLNVEDLTPSDETKRLLLGKAGYVVLFADGEGWILSGKTPLSDICKFFTIEIAKQHDRDEILKPYRVLP